MPLLLAFGLFWGLLFSPSRPGGGRLPVVVVVVVVVVTVVSRLAISAVNSFSNLSRFAIFVSESLEEL